MKVVLSGARLAFAKIWEPETFNGQGEPATNASFIFDPKAQKGEVEKIIKAINEVAKEKWGAKAADVLKTLKAKGDVCLHDGATKAEYDGFDGMVFISARNKARPVVVDKDKSPLTQADGKPYNGCYVNVSLDIWAQDNGYGKRINAKLLAIQFKEDGEAFGGGAGYSDDDFEVEGDGGSSGGDDPFGGSDDTAGDSFF